MFERRLQVLLLLLGLPVLGIFARLVQMQVVHGSEYQEVAEQMVRRDSARYFPALRGEIQDHEGRRLAYDAPAWDISVRYEVLTGNARYLRALAKEHDIPAAKLDSLVRESWQAIANVAGMSLEEVLHERERILKEVGGMKEYLSNLRGLEMIIAEEKMAHPLVRGLDQNQQAAARVALAAYPWVEVSGSQRRLYLGGESMGHLLGHLNEVSDQDLKRDPERGNELAAYQMGELRGISGIERQAERWLRGLRGRQEEDIEGRALNTVDPVNGRNYRLTIDLPLQQLIYEKLKKAVAANEAGSTGAAAVVIDIPSRQILALVSYPGFDPNLTPSDNLEEWRKLEVDELHRPLKPRAYGEIYPPGSIVKPMVLAGAWTDGNVDSGTRVVCTGQLSSTPPHFKCLNSHGEIGPVEAIQRSCNIFFYKVGEAVGVPRLSYWFGQAGLGRASGLDMVEESDGFLPKDSQYKGERRLTAIGQWQVRATPLQVANMVATVASGVWRPVTIWADDPRERSAVKLPVSDQAWRAVREGMFESVNKEGGTAHHHIHLENTGDLVLLGKTGSAEAEVGAVVERIFVCKFPDGSTDELVATNELDLRLRFPQTRNAQIIERRAFRYYPSKEMDPTHGWFAGYLTARDRYPESTAGGRLNVALVVMIEFGGRGGGVAAPVAGEIVQAMIDMQNGVDPNREIEEVSREGSGFRVQLGTGVGGVVQ